MKKYSCRKCGDVTRPDCYRCFTTGKGDHRAQSRVICKRDNIIGGSNDNTFIDADSDTALSSLLHTDDTDLSGVVVDNRKFARLRPMAKEAQTVVKVPIMSAWGD